MGSGVWLLLLLLLLLLLHYCVAGLAVCDQASCAERARGSAQRGLRRGPSKTFLLGQEQYTRGSFFTASCTVT
jgi:hypothetical protein